MPVPEAAAPDPTPSALRPADRHGTRSPSPARRGTAKPSRTLRVSAGASRMRLETLRLPVSAVSSATLMPGRPPRARPPDNGELLPILLLIRNGSLGSADRSSCIWAGYRRTTTMPSQTEIRQQVTQQIITALEQNLLPWRRPWRATTGGKPAGPALQRRLPKSIPRREPAPARTPRHAARADLTVVGDVPDVEEPRLQHQETSRERRGGLWGCRVVFWKPLTKTVVDDHDRRRGGRGAAFRPQDVHRLQRRPGRGCRGFPGA